MMRLLSPAPWRTARSTELVGRTQYWVLGRFWLLVIGYGEITKCAKLEHRSAALSGTNNVQESEINILHPDYHHRLLQQL
jgi:hypothetical protein